MASLVPPRIARASLFLAAALLVAAAPPQPSPERPPGPASGMAAKPSLESGTAVAAAERLKPGEFLWVPQVAPDGPLLVVINRKTQRLVVYRNGIPIGISTVSTGRPGYSTPTGIFTILQKHVEHYSSIYDNAPMPYMQRLTWQGVALHAGDLPGYPASHGCIRLPIGFARLLYGVTRLGMTVVITDRPALPSVAPAPEVLVGKTGPDAPAGGDAIIWTPEAAPVGPVSIVISAADGRVVVLRNGRLIGSAPVEIDGKLASPAVFVLANGDAAGNHWLRIPLPGQEGTAADQPPVRRDGIKVADSFRAAVRSILQPGTTVVLTPDTLRAQGEEPGEALIDAVSEAPGRR
jgi:hypothetical protein